MLSVGTAAFGCPSSGARLQASGVGACRDSESAAGLRVFDPRTAEGGCPHMSHCTAALEGSIFTQTSQITRPASRWQGGRYHPHETQRMLALEGVELASFARRAGAMAIDFAAIVAVFAAIVLPIALWDKQHQIEAHFNFDPFENWYSTLLPVIYFGLLVWLTNGRTLG